MNRIILTSEKRRQYRNLNLMFFAGFIFGFFIGFYVAKTVYELKAEDINARFNRIEEMLEVLGGGYNLSEEYYE